MLFSRDEKYLPAMRTGPSLRNGLEPRFEALPKTGKSPNSPGGVRAKALTPHPQLVNISHPFRFAAV